MEAWKGRGLKLKEEVQRNKKEKKTINERRGKKRRRNVTASLEDFSGSEEKDLGNCAN